MIRKFSLAVNSKDRTMTPHVVKTCSENVFKLPVLSEEKTMEIINDRDVSYNYVFCDHGGPTTFQGRTKFFCKHCHEECGSNCGLLCEFVEEQEEVEDSIYIMCNKCNQRSVAGIYYLCNGGIITTLKINFVYLVFS